MKHRRKKLIALFIAATMLLAPSTTFAAQLPGASMPGSNPSSRTADASIELLSYSLSATHFSVLFDLNYRADESVSNVRLNFASVTVQQRKAATGQVVNLGTFSCDPFLPASANLNVALSHGDELLVTCTITATLYNQIPYPFATVTGTQSYSFLWP